MVKKKWSKTYSINVLKNVAMMKNKAKYMIPKLIMLKYLQKHIGLTPLLNVHGKSQSWVGLPCSEKKKKMGA